MLTQALVVCGEDNLITQFLLELHDLFPYCVVASQFRSGCYEGRLRFSAKVNRESLEEYITRARPGIQIGQVCNESIS